MSDGLVNGLTWASVVGTALAAGVFFIFSVTVMQALQVLPPAQGIGAMQQINRTILAPWFLTVFIGTGLVAVVLGIRSFWHLDTDAGRWMLAASLLYLVGTLLVTMIFSVPRNVALDGLDPTATGSVAAWAAYLRGWTAWNHVRTAASIASLIAFVQAFRLA